MQSPESAGREMDGREIAAALRAWRESDEGRKCLDPGGIGLPERNARFLSNRIDLAFLAGVNAGRATPEGG